LIVPLLATAPRGFWQVFKTSISNLKFKTLTVGRVFFSHQKIHFFVVLYFMNQTCPEIHQASQDQVHGDQCDGVSSRCENNIEEINLRGNSQQGHIAET
jgi:hypothetical protein